MGKTALIVFIVLATVIFLLFMAGLVLFMFQYRKRKLLHEQEKAIINELHAKELLTMQLEIQQQTMQHIGREIHDNVGQKLTLAALYTQQLSFKNQYPLINEQITGIAGIINESLAELRSLSKNLASDHIQQTSLAELIKMECDKINMTGNCRAAYNVTGLQPETSNMIKTIVLRMVQEFMQNSLKHAACHQLTIDVDNSDKGLLVEAKDDGIGFNMTASLTAQGIGLENMKKRAELINADFTIMSSPGHGTAMRILVPVNILNT